MTEDIDTEVAATRLTIIESAIADAMREVPFGADPSDYRDAVGATLDRLVDMMGGDNAGDETPGDYVCAECGTRDADTFVVTMHEGDRTEVCRKCDDALRTPALSAEVVEQHYAPGSGFGVLVVQVMDGQGTLAVILANEDGQALAPLGEYSSFQDEARHKRVREVLKVLRAGKGERFLRLVRVQA